MAVPPGFALLPEAILSAKFVSEQLIVAVTKEGVVTTYYWVPKAHYMNP